MAMLIKVLIIFLLAFIFFSAPVLARDKSTQKDPFENMTLKRGNFHVHTKISSDGEDSIEHPGALELMDTFDSAERINLDIMGVTDHSHLVTDKNYSTEELWLITRGACALYTMNKELGDSSKQLIALPGFEWTGELHFNVFGTNQLAWTNEACIKPGKNLMRCGKIYYRPDIDSSVIEDVFVQNGVIGNQIDPYVNPAQFFPNYFFNKYCNDSAMDLQSIWSSHIESLYWRNGQPGPLGEKISSVPLEAATMLQVQGLQHMQENIGYINERWNGVSASSTGLLKEATKRMKRKIVDEPTVRSKKAEQVSADILETGLLIPPAIPLDNPSLRSDVIVDFNNRVNCAYASYYALLWSGLNLYDRKAPKSPDEYASSIDFIKATDSNLRNWYQNELKRMVNTRNEIAIKEGNCPSFYQWLASCEEPDPDDTIVAQINHISDGAPVENIISIVKKMDKLYDFKKYGYSEKEASNIRSRLCLLEMISGDNDPLHKLEGGPRKIFLLQHFYNFFLGNYLKLTPSTGVDNYYKLDQVKIKDEEFLPRQYSTGIWLNESNSGESDGRIKDVLKALRQRRTFVSENPYLKMKFYATIKNSDGTESNVNALMGEDIFERTSKSPDIRFHLVLEKEKDRLKDSFLISNSDIQLIAVKRPSEEWRLSFTKNADKIYDIYSLVSTGMDVVEIAGMISVAAAPAAIVEKIIRKIIEEIIEEIAKNVLEHSQGVKAFVAGFLTQGTTETENFANHFSRKCYRKSVSDCYKTIMEAEPSQKSLSKNGKNSQKGNKSLWIRNDMRNFNERGILHMEYDKSNVLPHHRGGAICYYALIKFPNGEYGITAPIWTCPVIPEGQSFGGGGGGSW
ncbi:MAG: hypothetical protein AB2L14_22700 [Candidatus Xenobiia bacterium LiM19]